MLDNEIPKHRSDKKYKKKPIILECKYVGNMPLARRMYSNGEWHKWKSYRDVKTAEEAKRTLERKWRHLIFRVKETQDDR